MRVTFCLSTVSNFRDQYWFSMVQLINNSPVTRRHPACHNFLWHTCTSTVYGNTSQWPLFHLPLAAVLRKPWTLKMRWMSFLDGPSMHAASTSWGRTTSRGSSSPFRPPTSRKRLVFDWSGFQTHLLVKCTASIISSYQSYWAHLISIFSTPKRLMIVLGDMWPAHSWFFVASVSSRLSFSQSK